MSGLLTHRCFGDPCDSCGRYNSRPEPTDAEWLEIVAKQTPEEGGDQLKWSWSLWKGAIAPRLRKIAASLSNPDRQTATEFPAMPTIDPGRLYDTLRAMQNRKQAARPSPCPCGFTCAKAEGRPMAAGCFCRAHR